MIEKVATTVYGIQYTPRNMHTVFALLCFVVIIHWLIFPYPSGLLHWHCGNLTIAPVPAKQLWWIWINTSCEFIMNDCITTTKQSTTKPCAYFLGYTVVASSKRSPWQQGSEIHNSIEWIKMRYSHIGCGGILHGLWSVKQTVSRPCLSFIILPGFYSLRDKTFSQSMSRGRSKKPPKLRVIGLCEGNSLVTGEFPAQRVSNTENVFILWRHHAKTE